MISGLEGKTEVEERLAPRTDDKAYHCKVFLAFYRGNHWIFCNIYVNQIQRSVNTHTLSYLLLFFIVIAFYLIYIRALKHTLLHKNPIVLSVF